jgi:hypothetical protein
LLLLLLRKLLCEGGVWASLPPEAEITGGVEAAGGGGGGGGGGDGVPVTAGGVVEGGGVVDAPTLPTLPSLPRRGNPSLNREYSAALVRSALPKRTMLLPFWLLRPLLVRSAALAPAPKRAGRGLGRASSWTAAAVPCVVPPPTPLSTTPSCDPAAAAAANPACPPLATAGARTSPPSLHSPSFPPRTPCPATNPAPLHPLSPSPSHSLISRSLSRSRAASFVRASSCNTLAALSRITSCLRAAILSPPLLLTQLPPLRFTTDPP